MKNNNPASGPPAGWRAGPQNPSRSFPWGWLLVFLGACLFTFLEWEAKREAKVTSAVKIPEDAQDHGRHLTLQYLGPSHYAGAVEGTQAERLLEEKYNLEITPIFLDANAYSRKKPLILSSGDAPDIWWEADPLLLQKAVEHGFIAEIPYALIQRHAPTYFRITNHLAPIAWTYSRVDGKNYGLPTRNDLGWRARPGLWRADWLRRVGIERIPETFEEMHEALQRFTFADPDGNGRHDTYGMSGDISHWWWTAFSEIFGAYGVLPFDWQEIDGDIVWGGLRAETVTVLALLRDWYREGLIHPEFVTDNAGIGQTLERKFFAGRIGYLNYRATDTEMQVDNPSSFYYKFVQQRMPEFLSNEKGLLEKLTENLPEIILAETILRHYRSWLEKLPDPVQQVLLSHPAAKTIPQWENWTRQVPMDIREFLAQTYFPASLCTAGRVPADLVTGPSAQPRGFFTQVLKRSLEDYAMQMLPTQLRATLLRQLQEALPAEIRPPLQDRTKCLAMICGSGSTAVLQKLLQPVFARWPQIRRQNWPSDLQALLTQWFLYLLRYEQHPPILVTAWFPRGPQGQAGARSWGLGGNIVVFNRKLARTPELVVRYLRMVEDLYTDHSWYIQLHIGREEEYWFWKNPEIGPGSGMVFNREFRDPVTGQLVDLQGPNVAYRRLLHLDGNFFLPTGSRPEFRDYFASDFSLTYRQTYQQAKWALCNALGKSDVVPSSSLYLGDLIKRQQTVFAEIIRGDKPLAAYEEFVRHWHERGGDRLLEEARAVYRDRALLYEQLRGLETEVSP